MSAYPEHDKLLGIQSESQVIGEFLEWLQNEEGIFLSHVVTYMEDGRERLSRLEYWHGDKQDLLARFFSIDRKKIEEEKLAMLVSLRKVQGQ